MEGTFVHNIHEKVDVRIVLRDKRSNDGWTLVMSYDKMRYLSPFYDDDITYRRSSESLPGGNPDDFYFVHGYACLCDFQNTDDYLGSVIRYNVIRVTKLFDPTLAESKGRVLKGYHYQGLQSLRLSGQAPNEITLVLP